MCTKRRRASDFISSKRRCMWAVPRGRYMLRQQSHHVCTARGDDRVAVPSSIDLATSSKCAPRAHAAMRITAAVDCPPRAGQRTRSASRCRAPTTSSTCSSTARSPWPASCVPSAACRFTASAMRLAHETLMRMAQPWARGFGGLFAIGDDASAAAVVPRRSPESVTESPQRKPAAPPQVHRTPAAAQQTRR